MQPDTVDRYIGLQRHDLLEIVRGQDAGGRKPDQLSCIETHLFGREDEHAGEVKAWMKNGFAQAVRANDTRCNLNDSSRHDRPLHFYCAFWVCPGGHRYGTLLLQKPVVR